MPEEQVYPYLILYKSARNFPVPAHRQFSELTRSHPIVLSYSSHSAKTPVVCSTCELRPSVIMNQDNDVKTRDRNPKLTAMSYCVLRAKAISSESSILAMRKFACSLRSFFTEKCMFGSTGGELGIKQKRTNRYISTPSTFLYLLKQNQVCSYYQVIEVQHSPIRRNFRARRQEAGKHVGHSPHLSLGSKKACKTLAYKDELFNPKKKDVKTLLLPLKVSLSPCSCSLSHRSKNLTCSLRFISLWNLL